MNYKEMSKDELIDEIKARRSNGSSISVDLRASEEKLIAALEMDDLENGSDAALEMDDLENGSDAVPANDMTSQIPMNPEAPTEATQPSDEVFAGGFRATNKLDGYTYQVAIVESDATKSYKARVPKQSSGHPGMFWEGSAEEFNVIFSKV